MTPARYAALLSFREGRNGMDSEKLIPAERGVPGWPGVWKKTNSPDPGQQSDRIAADLDV